MKLMILEWVVAWKGEGMSEHFKDIRKIQDILHGAQTGLWAIELEEGKAPRMYADSAMLELLGFDWEPTPEECYQGWYERIDHSYYPMIQDVVARISADERAEVQYPWIHPVWGKIYVRCGGVRDQNYTDGICLLGYHQNITNTVMLKQEYDTVVQTLNENYEGILLCNLHTRAFKMIKASERLAKYAESDQDYEAFLCGYANREIARKYQEQFLHVISPGRIEERISAGENPIEALYRIKEKHWHRVRVVPLKEYSSDYPWVIVAFDEQDDEMGKRIDEAGAQAAVSQTYRLVLSVDCGKTEYNCIHYAGGILSLTRHGAYEDFYGQLIPRMPSEDQREMERIFDIKSYRDNEYLEGMLRVYDEERVIHYYSYYSACIRQDFEERILLTVRNVDDKQEIQRREAILANLCKCYYSIYLFDLENNTEEAVWQEEIVRKNQIFPRGELDLYYERFVQKFVWPADQEKMRRAADKDFLRQTLSLEQPVYDIDFRRIYPTGIRWVRSRFSIAEIRDGQVVKVIFASMDINEQKLEELKEEEQNRKALLAAYDAAKSANEAKSNFLAQMSHDIRTPMNAIIGMTAIALGELDNPEKVKDCLDKINYSSSHLLKLINEILDMSKIEKGKIELVEEPFSLRKMLREINSIVRGEALDKNQMLRFKMEGAVHDCLMGDVGRIRQVLINLIDNAVKYTPECGSITVTTQEKAPRAPGTGCFLFTVEDNGIGMSREFLDYIFVPFSREEDSQVRRLQGTGLGMAISQGIVNAMQGDIRVESEKGKGSRFIITLNLKIREPEEERKPGDSPAEDKNGPETSDSLQGLRILLVEDNELNMEIAKTILIQSGLLIDSAENGEEALQIFTGSEPGTYQAVLMDLQMPVMDGYTASKEIRASGHPQAKTIPIIALTANAFAEDITKALASGMNDHVSKPIDFERLLSVLQKYIH